MGLPFDSEQCHEGTGLCISLAVQKSATIQDSA